ncbi:MAG: peroxiredoxin [Candidatus Kaiserbacteria bacterium]|nr:peroxiredoxin [Candidatus Kaiserbacteria bacterium]
MILEGQEAPAFLLKNQDGGEVSLDKLKGKWVVLYFYPKDDTPGCTTEGLEFSALRKEFEKHNAVVFGISKDTVESHKKFCEKHKFSIDLLSDEGGEMIEAYGAWREKNSFGKKTMGIVRSTVLIDASGTVIKHWKSVQAQGHAQQVLATIEK